MIRGIVKTKRKIPLTMKSLEPILCMPITMTSIAPQSNQIKQATQTSGFIMLERQG